MQRCIELVYNKCSYGIINLPSWLFLSSFEVMRNQLLTNYHIDSLLHMEEEYLDRFSAQLHLLCLKLNQI